MYTLHSNTLTVSSRQKYVPVVQLLLMKKRK